MALAMSVPDLVKIIKEKNPDIAVPSLSWVYLQFVPKNAFAQTALNYTWNLGTKYMVQSRQHSHEYVDQHKCAALILMLKVFYVKYRQCVTLVNLDDKHACKVGEPNYPIAAVDRGKGVSSWK